MQCGVSKIFGVITVTLAFTAALEAQTTSPVQPVARINGEAIYEQDLADLIGSQLMQVRTQEYELKVSAIEFLANQRLLDAEAKSKGMSSEALLEQSVYKTLPAPAASEIEAYYLAQKDTLKRPLAEVKAQLEQALTQARRQQARAEYVDQLRKKSNVAILLQRPKADVTVDTARLRGNPDAPVTIVEFSDFQCPYCKMAQPTIKEVLAKYKDKVRLGFRDMPLRQIHPQAQLAAEAARCAADQGKFWEYHDLLFASQQLDPASLSQYAGKAGLDVERFEGCTKGDKYKPMIENDLQMGSKAGVNGTPAFFVNGQFISGAQPLAAFEKIIDAELAASASKDPAPAAANR
jgi:protein-disulfide isomerase